MEQPIYLHFHVGRGGKFYNSGYVTFEGERNLQDVITLYSDYLFYQTRNKKGQFCSPYLTDANGNVVCDTPNSLTGSINFDGEYNSNFVCTLNDLIQVGQSRFLAALARDYDGNNADIKHALIDIMKTEEEAINYKL